MLRTPILTAPMFPCRHFRFRSVPRRLACSATNTCVPRFCRTPRWTSTSPRRLLRLASSAASLVVSQLQEIVLQSFQRIGLFIEVVPQVVRFFEHVLTVVDHAFANERRHAEATQRRTPGPAEVMRYERRNSVGEKCGERPLHTPSDELRISRPVGVLAR